MKVVIAEKPSVAKDIAKVLGANEKMEGYLQGNGYAITWAFGHLVQLEEPAAYGWETWNLNNLPMLPETFKLTLKDDPGAKKQYKIIKDLFIKSNLIIVATDAGREGELIFRYIYELTGSQKPFQRLWISSLTEEAIKDGFSKLVDGKKYDNLFYAARSRSEADWLVGLNATQCLTLSAGSRSALSLGRVQTPVLSMICKRFFENKNFKSVPFFEIEIILNKGKEFKVWHIKRFENKSEAETTKSKLGLTLECVRAETKPKNEGQPLLFDLTSLQSTANKKFGFSAQKTLELMQGLYETHKVLTYPRTSSQYLSEDVYRTLPNLFGTLEGKYADLVSELIDKGKLPKKSVDDTKVTDHHAIIPTGKKAINLTEDEDKIFDLVVRRFIASFSPICQKEITTYSFLDKGEKYECSGTILKVLGWRKAELEEKKEDDEVNDDEKPEQILPVVIVGDKVSITGSKVLEKKTKPKPILNEGSLLKMMESAGREIEDQELSKAIKECGLGTPATRANIIETLLIRAYIVRDKKKLLPTELGQSVYNLVKDYPISSPQMTGEWELKINKIAEGNFSDKHFITEIRKYTSEIVETLKNCGSQVSIKRMKCPKCKTGELNDGLKALNCTRKNEGCDFVLFKEISSKTLNVSQIEKLIEGKNSGLIKGFKKKDGSGSFDASIVFDENFKLKFDFGTGVQTKTTTKGEEKLETLKCPICKKGDILDNTKSYYCSEYKEGCKFTLWKITSGKEISKKDLLQLVKNGKTDIIKGFKKKDGSGIFDACLALEEGLVKFSFNKN